MLLIVEMRGGEPVPVAIITEDREGKRTERGEAELEAEARPQLRLLVNDEVEPVASDEVEPLRHEPLRAVTASESSA